MKKIIHLIVLISFTKMGFCQFQPMGCQTIDTTSSGAKIVNCSMASTAFHNYEDYYNTNLNIWKPNTSDNVKIIKINFIVVQKSIGNGGPGNFSQNGVNPDGIHTDVGFLNALVANVNTLYANFLDPSDNGAYNICGSCNQIKNSKIQFELQGINYFVDDNNYNTTTRIYSYNPGEEINIYLQNLTLNYDWTSSLPSYNYNNIQYIFLNRAYPDYTAHYDQALWGQSQMLTHELGHALGLCHTHLSGGCPESCQDMYNSGYYFDDVFGTYPGTCPDLGDWQSDSHSSSSDGITNNLMGNTFNREYLSPKQIAVFHRDIALKSVRRYLKTCVYNSGNTLNVSTNETWDFDMYLDRNLTVSSGNTLTLQCKLSMADGATITVNSGATLIIDQDAILTGACDNLWNGTLLVNGGGTLQIKNNGQLRMNENGLIKIDRSTQSANLIYDQGASILLNDNATCLEIKGNLTLAANANFTFTGAGYVKFSSTANPSNNIIANSGSSIALTGSGMTDKVLEITQETMNTTSSLSQFTVTYGQIAMAPNSRLSVPGPITFNNTKITKTTAGGHRGLWLYGQNNISLNVSVFEYGNYGIYDQMVNGGNVLNLNSCNFLNNTYGLYTINNKATLNYCAFNTNLYGWYATGMSQTSTVDNSTYINNDLGIKYFTSGTGGLKVSTSSITGNSLTTAGIEINGTGVLTVNCSTISNNELGILLQNNATLCMSPSQSSVASRPKKCNNREYLL